MFGLGWMEVLLVVAIGLILFARHLPSAGRWLGKTVVEVTKGARRVQDDVTR